MIGLLTLGIGLLALLLTWYVVTAFIFTLRRNYPPGPLRLPFIGNAFVFFAYPRSMKLARALQRFYGNVVSLYFGSAKLGAIVVSGADAIEEAMFAVRASGEPVVDRHEEIAQVRGTNIGLTWAAFHSARNSRRWVLKVMKNFGAYDGSAVAKIDEELMEFLDIVDMNCGLPWNPRRHLLLSVGAITHVLLFGRRPNPRETATYLSEMVSWSDEHSDRHIFTSFVWPSMPFVNHLMPIAFNAELAMQQKMEKLVQLEIDKAHRYSQESADSIYGSPATIGQRNAVRQQSVMMETPAPGNTLPVETPSRSSASDKAAAKSADAVEMLEKSQAANFVSYYLTQRKAGKAIDQTMFAHCLADLMLGSLIAVPDQILWALFYLAHMPDEQDRLYSEIIQNIKEGYLPGRSDLHRLVRVEAFINEVLRHATISPLVCMNKTTQELRLKGYTIPADTQIWYSAYSCHYDEHYWGDPENFRVDRWLSSDGRLISHASYMAAFGIGNRICPGEHLARLELFAYVVGVVQNYELHLSKPIAFNKNQRGFIRKVSEKAQFVFTKRTLPEEMAAQQLFD